MSDIKRFFVTATNSGVTDTSRKCEQIFSQEGGVICRKTFEKMQLEQQLKETQEKLKNYENGFKGACATCENVGELNIKLEQQLKETQEKLKIALQEIERLKNERDMA